MNRGQIGISDWRNITHNKDCTGTDITLHMNGNFQSGYFRQSQIVAYWAATFAAKITVQGKLAKTEWTFHIKFLIVAMNFSF